MRLSTICSLVMTFSSTVISFTITTTTTTTTRRPACCLFAQKKSSESEQALLEELQETPAGVAGAEFFGGNRQKEELYDPVAEAEADLLKEQEEEEVLEYNRFDDARAFATPLSKQVGESLQKRVNGILYEEEKATSGIEYASTVQWESPLKRSSSSPLQELQEALDFYKRLDIAIVSATEQSALSVQVRWEISLVWPFIYQARVLITGSSVLTLDDSGRITKQVDSLDQPDMLSTIVPQVLPRFWDTYHIGMTPSAETMPQIPVKGKGLLSKYRLYEIMPRVVYRPTLLDTGSREDAFAQVIPNHAFCTLIKTMGPKRQRYVPTSPVEVQLTRSAAGQQQILWNIPVSVEVLSNGVLPLPGSDPETPSKAMPTAGYEFQPKRRVASMAYGGSPQDAEVAEIRKELYEQVIKDGHTPKLDEETKRPKFFFLQRDAKACYTADGGLGMGVYDWRPRFAKSNEVGIELEVPGNELANIDK